jgi:hypothetical protein
MEAQQNQHCYSFPPPYPVTLRFLLLLPNGKGEEKKKQEVHCMKITF